MKDWTLLPLPNAIFREIELKVEISLIQTENYRSHLIYYVRQVKDKWSSSPNNLHFS